MKNFGQSYLLDMYACNLGVADDMEASYRFLECLVEKLGMNAMSAPIIIHAPTKDGVEIYPDLAGISGWVPLIQSGIQIHAIEPKHFISLDVFSCKPFDTKVVLDYAHEIFGFKMFHEESVQRGPSYPNGDGQKYVSELGGI